MIFGNPTALWGLLVIILILGLGHWGWTAKKNIFELFRLDSARMKRAQKRKYIAVGVLLTLLIIALALPQLPILLPGGGGKTGQIVLMVDVSGSMAAKSSLDGPNRLERVKPILYKIIDEFPEAEFWLFHFTDLARDLAPPVTKENFLYLKSSIARVLDINSVPGSGSDLDRSLSQVIDKIPEEKEAKLIVLFSDGEPYLGTNYYYLERTNFEEVLRKARQKKITIITVGVGEREGATIPIYDEEGNFTGEYAKNREEIYVSYLKEEALKEIAAKTQGKYFFETDARGIIDFIERNLVSGSAETRQEYQDISYLFLISAAVLWMIFARFYFK